MIAALDDRSGVIGWFTEDQLARVGSISGIVEVYGCLAESVFPVTPEVHAEAMRAKAEGQDMWFDGDAIVRRPMMTHVPDAIIEADGVETHEASGLPEGAAVNVNGDSAGTVAGGAFVMVCDTPGDFVVTVDLWPYMPLHYTVRGV